MSDDEVGLALWTWASYGQTSIAAEPADAAAAIILRADFIAPGGLAAIGEGTARIFPSCCCGIEEWREWQLLLEGGASPWLGHSPSPWVECVGAAYRVWSDGGMGEEPAGPLVHVDFSREELRAALEAAESDVRGFLRRVDVWAGHRAPDERDALVVALTRGLRLDL